MLPNKPHHYRQDKLMNKSTKTILLPTVPNGVPLQKRYTVLLKYDLGATTEGFDASTQEFVDFDPVVECEVRETPDGLVIHSVKNPDGITVRKTFILLAQ